MRLKESQLRKIIQEELLSEQGVTTAAYGEVEVDSDADLDDIIARKRRSATPEGKKADCESSKKDGYTWAYHGDTKLCVAQCPPGYHWDWDDAAEKQTCVMEPHIKEWIEKGGDFDELQRRTREANNIGLGPWNSMYPEDDIKRHELMVDYLEENSPTGDPVDAKLKPRESKNTWRKAPPKEPTRGEPATYIKWGHVDTSDNSFVKRVQVVVGVRDDGKYGNATKKAVATWQKAKGLGVDGVVGGNTWARIKRHESRDTQTDDALADLEVKSDKGSGQAASVDRGSTLKSDDHEDMMAKIDDEIKEFTTTGEIEAEIERIKKERERRKDATRLTKKVDREIKRDRRKQKRLERKLKRQQGKLKESKVGRFELRSIISEEIEKIAADREK